MTIRYLMSLLFIIISLILSSTTSFSQYINTNYYYKIQNDCMGKMMSIDIIQSGNDYQLTLSKNNNSNSQLWDLIPEEDGYYRLINKKLGDGKGLEIVEHTGIYSLHMNKIPGSDAQYWRINPTNSGSYKFTPLWLEDEKKRLEYEKKGNEYSIILADSSKYCEQGWILNQTQSVVPGGIASTNPIPDLIPNPKQNPHESMGPSDPNKYPKTTGEIKAIMVFVDFLDATGRTTQTNDVANNILGYVGYGGAKDLLKFQSYGKLSLEVDFIHGWRHLNKKSEDYACNGKYSFCDNTDDQRIYIADVLKLFKKTDFPKFNYNDFSYYDMVFIVASPNSKLPISPAFTESPGEGVVTPKGEVRLAVTFGQDSYTDYNGRLLVHEFGHLIGLLDLYPDPKNQFLKNEVDRWAIMSDHENGTGFIGWNRHKSGWMDSSSKHYIRSGSHKIRISPLSAYSGISMIVVPIDDPSKPTKVYVIEVAQPIIGKENVWFTEGVLIYSVDADILSQDNPVVIQRNNTEESAIYGPLYKAPYGVGDIFKDSKNKLTVEVLKKLGNSYIVEVTVP